MTTTRWVAPGKGASVAALLEELALSVGRDAAHPLIRAAFEARVECERTNLELLEGFWDSTDTGRVKAAVAAEVERADLATENRIGGFLGLLARQRAVRLAHSRG